MKLVHRLLIVVACLIVSGAHADAAAPVRIDATKMPRGILLKIKVNSLPVFIINRRLTEIAALRKSYANHNKRVPGCPECDPSLRSISKDYFVVWGYNPSSKCELIYVSSTARDWIGHAVHGRGGFVDKCSNSEFDLTGRKLVGPKTSPSMLGLPQYSFHNGVIEINPSTVYNR